MKTLELCAGAGGQALGLEKAGFEHTALFENDASACNTLKHNRPEWHVLEHDLFEYYDFAQFRGVDLVAGGLPCPPFSLAGKQLGDKDERNLFNVGLNIVEAVQPRAVIFENVRGMLGPRFLEYREWIKARLKKMGLESEWKLLNACDFGVPQLRPRAILVALRPSEMEKFRWPEREIENAPSVGEAIGDLMSANGWHGVEEWKKRADRIAPTLVGGSKKHGGPDLGPTRARHAWAQLGVTGTSLANEAPDRTFDGDPRLTVDMAARIQGFPDEWRITGRKTAAYRQVGNAFPPPVAEAVGRSIAAALRASQSANNLQQTTNLRLTN